MVQRVIIHAGTMKTGTTALQMYMNDRREEHAKLGVYYPQTPDGRFNHQQLLSALKNGNGSALVAAVAKGISESPKNTHTVFFSHEGIFEGWHRFAPHRREDFQKLATIYPLEVWAFFREPLQLMMSFHNQYAKRVRLDLKGQAHLTLEQRLNDPHFISNCDYKGFVKSVEKEDELAFALPPSDNGRSPDYACPQSFGVGESAGRYTGPISKSLICFWWRKFVASASRTPGRSRCRMTTRST